MSATNLKLKLLNKQTVYGTLLAHTIDPSIVKWLPDGMLDFVIVTPEHTAYDIGDFLAVRHALEAKGIACLARTHSRDESDVAKVCDSYDGVVVPYVEDIEEAKRLAAAALYRPLKGKVLDRALATGKWPSDKTRDYIAKKNAETIFIPMIESVPAIENLDGICSIPGIDALFVGPGDMSANMGIPKEYDHPDLIANIQKVIDAGNKHNITAGCWFGTPEQALRTIKQGARLVVYGNDGLLLQQAMENIFPKLQQG